MTPVRSLLRHCGAAVLLAMAAATALPAAAADVVLPQPDVYAAYRGYGLCAIPQGDGKVIVCGNFDQVNGVRRTNLARLLPDGSVDPAFRADTTGVVYSVAIAGGFLYVGGMFDAIGGQPRSNLARVSLATGAVDAWTMDANLSVTALMVDGGDLYAGGWFTTIGGAARTGLARIATGSGLVDPGFDHPLSPIGNDRYVRTIQREGAYLYLGGRFSAIDGQSRGYAARIDLGTNTLDAAWSPRTNGTVHMFAFGAASVYVGGDFTQIDGADSKSVAKVAKADGRLDTAFALPAVDSFAYSIAIDGNALQATGYFSLPDRSRVCGVTRVDAATGAIAACVNLGGYVFRAVPLGNRLLAVGAFIRSGPVAQTSLALMDPATLQVDVTRNLSLTMPATIYAMAQLPDGTVLIGGQFDEVNGKRHANLAQLNADGTLNPGWTIDTNASVQRLLVDGNMLYVAGGFGMVGDVNVPILARVNLVSRAVDTGFVNTPDSTPVALAINDGFLYVGGAFAKINGVAAPRLARIALATGSLDANWKPNPDDGVTALVPAGTDLIVGGSFQNIGGLQRRGVAKISGSTGLADTGFAADLGYYLTGMPAVYGLSQWGNSLYAVGNFTQARAIAVRGMAKLDASNGSPVAGFAPVFSNPPSVVLATPSAVYVGGSFSSVGTVARGSLARLDPLTGAVDETMPDLAAAGYLPVSSVLLATANRIWIAGLYDTIGGKSRRGLAAIGPLAPQVVTVFEFFAPSLNHYFRTANAEEAAALKANPALGFNATGNDFQAYARGAYPADASPVYRFYGSVTPGPNSHFYTADFDEYQALFALQFAQPNTQPRWNFEEIAFAINQPVARDACPSSAPVKVYRAYNGRALQGDSNHRLTTDLNAYDQLVAAGWRAEGVVACALD